MAKYFNIKTRTVLPHLECLAMKNCSYCSYRSGLQFREVKYKLPRVK